MRLFFFIFLIFCLFPTSAQADEFAVNGLSRVYHDSQVITYKDPYRANQDISWVLSSTAQSPFYITAELNEYRKRIETDLDILDKSSSTAQVAALYRESRDILEVAGRCFDESTNFSLSPAKREALFAEGNSECKKAQLLILQACKMASDLHLSIPDYEQAETINVPVPDELSIFVPGLQNLANEVNFLSSYHPVDTIWEGMGFAAGPYVGRLFISHIALPITKITAEAVSGGMKFTGQLARLQTKALSNSLSQIIKILDHSSPSKASLAQVIQKDAQLAKSNSAINILINQKQVNIVGKHVGDETIHLQLTQNKQRFYVMYSQQRLLAANVQKYAKILANDPNSIFIEKLVKAELKPGVSPLMSPVEEIPPTAPSFSRVVPEPAPEARIPASSLPKKVLPINPVVEAYGEKPKFLHIPTKKFALKFRKHVLKEKDYPDLTEEQYRNKILKIFDDPNTKWVRVSDSIKTPGGAQTARIY